MDGENIGKPIFQRMIWGENPPFKENTDPNFQTSWEKILKITIDSGQLIINPYPQLRPFWVRFPN